MIYYSFFELCMIITECKSFSDFDDVTLYVFEHQDHYIQKCGTHFIQNIKLLLELQRKKQNLDHQNSQ